MLTLLTINWNQLLPQILTLWFVGWGIRALLIGVILGGLVWMIKRRR
ncbi:hypothetical protein [Levilactobacillus yonginensis]